MRGAEVRTAMLTILVAAAGCAGEVERTDPPPAEESASVEAGVAEMDPAGQGSADAGPSDSVRSAAEAEGALSRQPGAPGAALLPGEKEEELRSYRLLLVNPTGMDAVVFASAGADRVVLDTVLKGDSSRVDVEVRSRWIRLEAAGERGIELGGEELELEDGALFRWQVPGEAPPGP